VHAIILLVHGDPVVRDSVGESLRVRGIGVVPLSSVPDALSAAAAVQATAVLLDPELLVRERTRLGSKLEELSGRAVRVIALTHQPTAVEADAIRRHGATALIRPLAENRLAENLLVLADLATQPQIPSPPATEPVRLASSTVLLVDDSETIRMLASRMLTAAGYRVFTASNAANALRIVASGIEIHAVVSDLLMPGMDGFELKHEIDRSRDVPMPFVLVTAEASAANREMALRLGSSAFVAKPLDAKTLVAAVAELLAGRSSG
jgi:two-component system, chemotaxis family, chemotaxis protein CheY